MSGALFYAGYRSNTVIRCDGLALERLRRTVDDYKDLIVRVAGYSDYFRNLDEELQNEIINRTAQSF